MTDDSNAGTKYQITLNTSALKHSEMKKQTNEKKKKNSSL